MELDTDSIDIEFDSEFMRLYYDKFRSRPPIFYKVIKNKTQSPIEEQRNVESNNEIGGAKRQYEYDRGEARPLKLYKPRNIMKVLENHTTQRQKGLSPVKLIALKSRNNLSKDKGREPSVSNLKLRYKGTMLKECSPAFLQMACGLTNTQIDIFDNNSSPLLKKQIIKVDSTRTVVRFQAIKKIIMKEIPGKEDIEIPQISMCNNDIKIYLCPLKECNEGFLQCHIAKNHTLSHLALRPFRCHFIGCGWTFAKESHLQRHLTTHENIKNYSCTEPGCDKLFTTVYNLNDHKKKRHIQPATKPCPVLSCDKTFRNEKEMRTHCKQHNCEDAPLNCVFAGCTKAFFFQSTLEAHTKTHLEENQHICTFNNCNKIFQQAYRLKEHMRCHTGAKPYKCTIGKCTKAFSTASKLKRHEISHFDDKNHYCNVEGCDKAFKRSDHLNEHVRQVHKVTTQGQKALTSSHLEPLRAESSQSLSSDTNNPMHTVDNCLRNVAKLKTIASRPTCTSESQTLTSEDEETNLSNYLAFNSYGSQMSGCSNMNGCSKTEDELLDEAIKSLGVPEMKLETDLFLEEPLDLSDFSTVNLRDLH